MTQNPTYPAASGNTVPKSVINATLEVTLLEIQAFNSVVIQKRHKLNPKLLTNFWSKLHIAFFKGFLSNGCKFFENVTRLS